MDTAIESSAELGGMLNALSDHLPFVAISAGTLSLVVAVYFLISIIIKIKVAKNTKVMHQNIHEIRSILEEIRDQNRKQES